MPPVIGNKEERAGEDVVFTYACRKRVLRPVEVFLEEAEEGRQARNTRLVERLCKRH